MVYKRFFRSVRETEMFVAKEEVETGEEEERRWQVLMRKRKGEREK
jgi:hypothetical protein